VEFFNLTLCHKRGKCPVLTGKSKFNCAPGRKAKSSIPATRGAISSQPNEAIMIISDGLKVRTATWWALDGKWVCVGAMKGLSKSCPWSSPEIADKAVRQQGHEPVWKRRHSPANPGRLY
jgi:hypothetical protein